MHGSNDAQLINGTPSNTKKPKKKFLQIERKKNFSSDNHNAI